MGDGWERAQQVADQQNTGLFIRLKNDGDSVVVVFCGEPFAREVVFKPQGNDPKQKEGISVRFAINAYDLKEGAMRILELNRRWFDGLLAARKKYGLVGKAFEVTRCGAAGDTKTTYSTMYDRDIDQALTAKIAAIPLHDLEKATSGNSDGAGASASSAPTADTRSPALIDPRTTEELGNRLRALPREPAFGVLKAFGIKRVGELRADDAPKARAMIERLEAAHATPPQTEIDPFG